MNTQKEISQKKKFTSIFYLYGVKVLFRIELQENNRKVFNYELEDGKMFKSEFQRLEKEFHCSCGNIKKIKKIDPDKKYSCRSCLTKGEKNPMSGKSMYKVWVEKYGKEKADEKMREHQEKYKGEKNHFFGKKHTEDQKNKWSSAMKGKYRGEKNPMYGRSVYSLWVEKYGEDKAKDLMNRQIDKMSEIMTGENNPMHGRAVYSIWVEKYGDDFALDMMIENSAKIKNTFLKKKESGEWDKIRHKISKALKKRNFTDEHRHNLRVALLNYISKFFPEGRGFVPAYNPAACEYFEKLSKEKNINIQHALNGGEFHIKELGYFVDGYDKENNVVYEYDEPFHYNIDGTLKEKDSKRQKEIENLLKCDFIRIKQKQK